MRKAPVHDVEDVEMILSGEELVEDPKGKANAKDKGKVVIGSPRPLSSGDG